MSTTIVMGALALLLLGFAVLIAALVGLNSLERKRLQKRHVVLSSNRTGRRAPVMPSPRPTSNWSGQGRPVSQTTVRKTTVRKSGGRVGDTDSWSWIAFVGDGGTGDSSSCD